MSSTFVEYTSAALEHALPVEQTEDRDCAGIYPLTSSQREIWFDQTLHEHSSMYNIGGYVSKIGRAHV